MFIYVVIELALEIQYFQIKLIVIDSLSFTLQMVENKSKMFELLLELHESMRDLQRKYKVAVSFEDFYFYFASLKVLL